MDEFAFFRNTEPTDQELLEMEIEITRLIKLLREEIDKDEQYPNPKKVTRS